MQGPPVQTGYPGSQMTAGLVGPPEASYLPAVHSLAPPPPSSAAAAVGGSSAGCLPVVSVVGPNSLNVVGPGTVSMVCTSTAQAQASPQRYMLVPVEGAMAQGVSFTTQATTQAPLQVVQVNNTAGLPSTAAMAGPVMTCGGAPVMCGQQGPLVVMQPMQQLVL